MKYLLINGHQFYNTAKGKLNKSLYDVFVSELSQKGEIMETIIEKGYNPAEEVEKHLNADVVITQMPVYWFGGPWIHKKYIDEVFNTGYGKLWLSDGRTRSNSDAQYGTGGGINKTKKFMLSVTYNAPEEAFNNPNHHIFKGKSVMDVMSTNFVYQFCGFEILETFSCHDVIKAPDFEKYKSELVNHINKELI